MNIAYNTDDNFVPQVCASICSVCENNRNVAELTFHILGAELSQQSKDNLSQLVESYGREMRYYEIGDIKEHFNFSFDTLGWRPVILARLLIDKILPETVERVVYLDGDTIVRSDISELDTLDMQGCPVAGVIEPTVNKKNLEKIGLAGHPYINSGVLVIDAGKWRKEAVGDEIISYYAAHDGRLFAPDQDAINGALKGRIKYISPAYNYCNNYDYYNYKTLVSIAKPVNYHDYVSAETFAQANRDPKIIHYLGEERPWRIGNRHHYKDDFEKYLSMTAYKDMKFEDGWQTYFKCFYLFNGVIKICPLLRHRIITALIPVFMKYRKKQLAKEKNK